LAQAVAQHNAGCDNWATAAASSAYQNAKNLADLALAQLAEARTHLERASQLEPGVDLTQVSDAIAQVEDYISLLHASCDSGIAVNIDVHLPQCNQVRENFGSLPRDISFDMVSWVASIRDEYIASIEDHLAKEAEYRRRAAEVWAQNNP
jgi:hypothetical protein